MCKNRTMAEATARWRGLRCSWKMLVPPQGGVKLSTVGGGINESRGMCSCPVPDAFACD